MDKNKPRDFIKRLAAGAIIGAGAIVPGVSGSVLAVTLGIYERSVAAMYALLKNFRKAFRESVSYLAPIGIGGVCGLGITALALTWLMTHFRTPVIMLFMGLVIGGLPGLAKEGNQDGFRKKYLLTALCGVLFFALLAFAERLAGLSAQPHESLNMIESFFSGIIAGLAIVPGASISFMLMLLGWYDAFIAAIGELHLLTLIPAGIGFVISFCVFLKLVHLVFNRFRAHGYYAVTGFTAASAIYLIAETVRGGVAWWHFLFLAAGIVIAFLTQNSNPSQKEG